MISTVKLNSLWVLYRYDQECTGLSTGDQISIEFEHWLEDALAMVDRVCEGPVILVASSVGSWVSLTL